MAQTFQCPACGAALDVPQGNEATVRCPYCGQAVIVPETLRAASPPSVAGADDEIVRLLRSGNKIQAIQIYHERYRTGLAEAKLAVEQIADHLDPLEADGERRVSTTAYGGQRRRRPAWAGWAIALLAVLILGAALVPMWFAFGAAGFAVSQSTDGLPSQAPGAGMQAMPLPTLAPSRTPAYAAVLLHFGSPGAGPGRFEDARSIALGPEGNLYVAEYLGGRVQVFDARGNFLTQWQVDPEMPLRSMAVDRNGTVYIVQSGKIMRYAGDSGDPLGELVYPGGAAGGFDEVAAIPGGGLAAFYDQAPGDDIVLFDGQGGVSGVIASAVSPHSGSTELSMQLAVDGAGNVYALAGTFDDGVFKFGPDGRFLTRFGSRGDEPGQFTAPSDVAVDGLGRVYVSDFKGVQVFDGSGRYLGLIDVDGIASGLVINGQDELFVAGRTQVWQFAAVAE
ncbi:MAG: hypothetical protein GYA17_16710 [Chloroflexi bacterium]|nr:hypothetical protein [Chloroflexota bacterium]